MQANVFGSPLISCQYSSNDIVFVIANEAENMTTILFHSTGNYSLQNQIMQMFSFIEVE